MKPKNRLKGHDKKLVPSSPKWTSRKIKGVPLKRSTRLLLEPVNSKIEKIYHEIKLLLHKNGAPRKFLEKINRGAGVEQITDEWWDEEVISPLRSSDVASEVEDAFLIEKFLEEIKKLRNQ